MRSLAPSPAFAACLLARNTELHAGRTSPESATRGAPNGTWCHGRGRTGRSPEPCSLSTEVVSNGGVKGNRQKCHSSNLRLKPIPVVLGDLRSCRRPRQHNRLERRCGRVFLRWIEWDMA